MRKRFGMWMHLCVLCAFMACSDDNNNDGTVTPPEPMPWKQVKQIKMRLYEEGYGTAEHANRIYSYDKENRIIRIDDLENTNEATTYVYTKDTITGVEYNGEWLEDSTVYTLVNGKLVRAESENAEGRFSYACTYDSDNRLSRIVIENKDENDTETEEFQWNGNLTGYKYSSLKDHAKGEVTLRYSGKEYVNNANIDLFYLLSEDAGLFDAYMTGDMFLLGIVGQRSYYMPTGIEVKWEDDEGAHHQNWNLTYEKNTEGYITKMSVFLEEGKNLICEITYQ